MGQSKGIRSIWAAALLAGGLALAVGARADAPAGDAARGAKVAYTCLGCHGIPDYRNAYPNYRVPKLGGQHAAYLAAALGEYRAGARPHPTMRGQAGSISEQDVRDVAAYFATPTPVASARTRS
jgi:cytochrome c553